MNKVTIEGKQYYEHINKPNYFPWMVARDFLGDAKRFPELIRKKTFENITNDVAKQLTTGEIILIPVKSSNPTPGPSSDTYPNNIPDPSNSSSDNTWIWLGLGGVALFFLLNKKRRK